MIQKKIDWLFEKLAPLGKVSWLIKRIIYIACFVWLCHLDHIIGSANGAIQYAWKYYTGIVIGIIILTSYKLRDFLRLPYVIWAVVFWIGRHYALQHAPENYWDMIEYKAYVWIAGLYGLILIRMIYGLIIEKKKPAVNWPVYLLWLVMMVGMVAIRPDMVWPKVVLVTFGTFYLADFGKEGLRNLCIGMVEGILLGFLYVQGQAVLHRPYDVLRYQGYYSNPNINALFYLFCYCAVLCKWYQLKLERKHILRRIPMVILCGVLWSLTFFTMGRTALLSMGLITLLFLLFVTLLTGKWWKKLIYALVSGTVIVLAVAVTFVPTYNVVRYVPAYVNDIKYFEGDYWEAKVHPDDPIDSEKYIDLDTVIEESFGRLLWFLGDEESAEDEIDAQAEAIRNKKKYIWLFGPAMRVQAAESREAYVEPGADEEHPILETAVDESGSVAVRMSIYKHYFKHLNVIGEFDGFRSLWVTSDYSAPHPHNLLLYIASEFGWLIGLMFAALVILLYVTVVRDICVRKTKVHKYYLFLMCSFTTALFAFGLLEMCWIFGQIPFTMYFVVLYLLCHKSYDIEEA